MESSFRDDFHAASQKILEVHDQTGGKPRSRFDTGFDQEVDVALGGGFRGIVQDGEEFRVSQCD